MDLGVTMIHKKNKLDQFSASDSLYDFGTIQIYMNVCMYVILCHMDPAETIPSTAVIKQWSNIIRDTPTTVRH